MDRALAQTAGLTPEQQRMLNQLPPSQRQQALQALRQYQGGQVQSVGARVRESAAETAADLSPVVRATPEAEVSTASANSRLVIRFTPKESLTDEDLRELRSDPVLSRLEGSRSFVLDDSGLLSLLGVVSIPLLGLTQSDIERRLEAEPLLGQFDVSARILQTRPTGVEALEPFGYRIFEPHEAGFDPPMTGPVPPDYVLGPGDTVRVQLFGNVNSVYELDVTRDGVINLPEIGPFNVAGLRFSEFREEINRRVSEMLIGTQVSVTMGQLRTIRIFVLGEANRPGSYIVSSLATISSALYRSGGISRIGSLRDIQLKRNGGIAARLDLYDLLLDGDTSGDQRLQPGDVIFIPPIGTQVSVSGAVKRPAIYETKRVSSVADAIRLAGGLLPDAYPDGARIERIDPNRERIVIAVDADSSAAVAMRVFPGDIVTIPEVLPEFRDTITLLGQVQRPGPYQWRNGMRLTDLIKSQIELKQNADGDYVLIRREDPQSRRISVVSANLSVALVDPRSTENVALQPRDTVYVFGLEFGRQRVIQPILEELQLQSKSSEPYSEVSVSGRVKAAGTYPLEPNMRVSDLIRAGGNLNEQAYTLGAEIARYEIIGGEYRETRVIDVDLAAILRGDVSADLFLEEHDNLRISTVPQWDSLWTVSLEGEVRFPGSYRIRRGETLRQVLDRAGGLTAQSFPEGAIFLRESLKQREQEQIAALARRLEADLASQSLENRDAREIQSLQTGQSLLAQLQSTRAVGRLVIDLNRISGRNRTPDPSADLELRDGDRLLVPKQAQEVTVIGETQQNTSHLYQAGLSRDAYINMSGGLTRRADEKLIYVVRASGAVVADSRSRWLGRRTNAGIRPGDTIVVPLETDRIRPLTLWTNVTQILYQAAIAVAAVRTFDQ